MCTREIQRLSSGLHEKNKRDSIPHQVTKEDESAYTNCPSDKILVDDHSKARSSDFHKSKT